MSTDSQRSATVTGQSRHRRDKSKHPRRTIFGPGLAVAAASRLSSRTSLRIVSRNGPKNIENVIEVVEHGKIAVG